MAVALFPFQPLRPRISIEGNSKDPSSLLQNTITIGSHQKASRNKQIPQNPILSRMSTAQQECDFVSFSTQPSPVSTLVHGPTSDGLQLNLYHTDHGLLSANHSRLQQSLFALQYGIVSQKTSYDNRIKDYNLWGPIDSNYNIGFRSY